MRFTVNKDNGIHDAAFPRNDIVIITVKNNASSTEREYANHICALLNAGVESRRGLSSSVPPDTLK